MGRLDGLPPDIILAIFDNLFYLRDIPSLARASSSVYGVFSCYKAFILDHGLQRNLNAESIPYVARIFVFSSSIDPDNPCEKKKKIRLHLTRPLEQFKSPDFGNLKTSVPLCRLAIVTEYFVEDFAKNALNQFKNPILPPQNI